MHAKSQVNSVSHTNCEFYNSSYIVHILRVCGQSRLCVSLTQSAESCVPSGACIASTVLPAGRRITMYMLSIARPRLGDMYLHTCT